MKRFYCFSPFILAVFFLVSCANITAIKNRKKLNYLKIGMTKADVLRLMGEPLKNENYHKPDVWYYFSDEKWADTVITEDECTPVIFREGKVVGWGKKYYNENYKYAPWNEDEEEE